MLIHERIRAGDYPNCRKLAREVEVCTRTVKRDVDFMRYRDWAPLRSCLQIRSGSYLLY
jgi:predicted DNA-binding transcriptional regulator YafY